LLVGEIYHFFLARKITIKLPESVPPNVANQFTALIPGAFTLTVFLIVKLLLANAGFVDFKSLVFTFIQTPLKNVGTSVGGFMVLEFVAHLLWTVGIHGHNIINAVGQAPLVAASLENLNNFKNGLPITNIITDDFKTFIYIGGAGATLPLAFMMTFLAKSKQVKEIGKLSLLPGIFNINEPITFGLPIILNPFMIIPFMITPLVLVLVSYFGIASGIFPMMVGISAPWTTPKLLLAYISSNGNIMASVLVLINFVIAGLIYYPFFRIWDKRKVAEESKV
jgi:PTS system cellobiose-specific IIC component